MVGLIDTTTEIEMKKDLPNRTIRKEREGERDSRLFEGVIQTLLRNGNVAIKPQQKGKRRRDAREGVGEGWC